MKAKKSPAEAGDFNFVTMLSDVPDPTEEEINDNPLNS